MAEESLKDLCIRLEHYETPQWAIDEILKREILTPFVVDPCCGTGVMADAVRLMGHQVYAEDIYDWGYPFQTSTRDFLACGHDLNGITVFMNPPFSKAEQFVRHAIARNAKKIVCFQRFAWWESAERKEFWDSHSPNRIYICGSRATCWRYDIAKDENGRRYELNDDGSRRYLGGASTAHAWFVWEGDQAPGTLLHRIYKDGD